METQPLSSLTPSEVKDKNLDPNQSPAWAEFTKLSENVTQVSPKAGFQLPVTPIVVPVIQPLSAVFGTAQSYTVSLAYGQTGVVYVPVAYAKSAGALYLLTLTNGTSSVTIQIPASTATITGPVLVTLFCDASGVLTLQGDITSSGSNSNGSWIQFADGTMECRFMDAVAHTTNVPYIVGQIWCTGLGAFTFPVPFVRVPNVTPQFNILQAGTGWGIIDGSVALSNVNIRSMSGASTNTHNLGFLAIGPWK